MLYDNLWLISLSREQHADTAGYWYLITARGLCHEIFRAKPALTQWLTERGLVPSGRIPDPGTVSAQQIMGSYSRDRRGDWMAQDSEPATIPAPEAFQDDGPSF